jgi:hypothetical protein
MRVRDGQVDDHVDLVIGEKLVDRLCLHAVFLGAGLSGLHVDIGAGQNLQTLEERGQRKVGGGDIAASNDADTKFLGHDMPQ